MEMNDLLETLVETNIKSLQYLQVFSELFKFRLEGGVTRPCARARQAKRVLTQGRRGIQGRTGASRDKELRMT